MEIRNPKKVASLIMGAVATATFAGANLQTLVLGATEITEELTELVAEEYSIGTAEGFLHFRDLVNAGRVSKDAKIMLTTDLDLTEGGKYTHGYCDEKKRKTDGSVEWASSNRYIPVGTEVNSFIAKFDGQGKEITLTANVEATAARVYAGVFGVICGGSVVENLKISEGSYIAAKGSSGAFALYAGGIVGAIAKGSKISECSNEGEVKVSGTVQRSYAGGVVGFVGICGFNRIGSEINGCHNIGAVSGQVIGGMVCAVGGIAGWIFNKGKASECSNEGEVKVSGTVQRSYAGGVVGRAREGSEINGCCNQGAVRVSGVTPRGCVGGIAGAIAERSKISNCHNTDVVGCEFGEETDVVGCEFGEECEVCDVGGIVGKAGESSEISECGNIGTVSGQAIGGMVCAVGGDSRENFKRE